MELAQLAIDRKIFKGKEKFIIVEKDHPERTKSIEYDKERNALRWVKLATGFRQDISLMPITRLYEDNIVIPSLVIEEETFTVTYEGNGDENPFQELMAVKVEEPKEEIIPWLDTYFCTKCQKNHRKTESKLGRNHLKYREVN